MPVVYKMMGYWSATNAQFVLKLEDTQGYFFLPKRF